MALRDELILDVRNAFRELDALQGRLDNLSDIRLDVSADTSGLEADLERSERLARETSGAFGEITDQVVLTTDEYRQAVRLIQEGEDATRAVATVTGRVADEAGTAEDAFRRVAAALDLSEDDARELATSIGRSTREATDLESDMRQVARSMGLSEDEASDFTRQMRLASGEAATLDRRTDDIATGWNRLRTVIAGAVAAIGVRGLARGFGSAVDAASELEQSIGGVQAIFGEAADDILLVGESADEAVGLAENAFNQLAARLGGQLQTFGFNAEQASRETVNLIELGADLAATYGGPVSDAVEAISSLLRGEIDPIERYAVSINQAAINAEALRLGLVNSTSEVDIQTRAMAALSLLNQQTATAQGQFAREAETTAGQLERLRAEAGNLQAEIGEGLIPAFNEGLEIAQTLAPAIRALGESFAAAGEDAQGGASGFETAAQTLFGLPRGFGVLSDLVTGLGSAVGNAGSALANLFAGPLTLQGFDAFNQDVEEGTAALQGMFDSLQQRAILESFIGDLQEGVDPALAFANAAAATARNNELTAESFQSLARISGVSDSRLRDTTLTMLDQAEAAGLDADEVAVLENQIRLLNDALGLRPEDRDRSRFSAENLERFEELGDAGVEAAEKVEQLDDALSGIGGIAEDTGLSFETIARNIGAFDEDLVPLVNQIGAGTLVTENFDRALRGLQTATRFDLGDAVDEFDLLISKTNEAGDEVPATVEEMLTDLSNQADRFARLEAATTILEALGFDSLASELRQQGPDAAAAAEEFVNDIESAAEAEDILDRGGQIGDDLLEGLEDALERGDITPEMLELAEQFTSSQVRQSITNQATELGGLFGQELLDAIDLRTDIRIPVNLIPEIQGSTGGSDPTGTGAVDGGGGSGGGGNTFNITNNFDQPTPSTDTQRISQSVANVIRSRVE